jgi:hypothetical protein
VARTASQRRPWESHGEEHSQGPDRELVIAIGDAARTLMAAVAAGTEEQRLLIRQLLSEFRQTLVAIVPEASDVGPFAGRRRGPWSKSGPGWSFGVPDWIFGSNAPFGKDGWPSPSGFEEPADRDVTSEEDDIEV